MVKESRCNKMVDWPEVTPRKAQVPTRPEMGRIFVGRTFTNKDEFYASIEIDELVFFNMALNNGQIVSIYKAV